MSRLALFLDRDGVINADYGHVYKPEDIQFIDGIFELVATANNAGYLVVVITNQAGIGRGYYSEDDFHRLTSWMKTQFALRAARIDDVYYCPFHPEHGLGEYRRESDCRKPAPGMLLRAASEHDIDLKHSVLVGDKSSDLEAGRRAGIGKLLFFGDVEESVDGIVISRLDEALQYLMMIESSSN